MLIASGVVSAPLRSALASALLTLVASAARAAPVVEAEPSRLALYNWPAAWAVPAITCTLTNAGSLDTLW